MSFAWTDSLPFGTADIEQGAADRYAPSHAQPLVRRDSIRCCVRGCEKWLSPYRRGTSDPSAFCSVHGIRMSTSPTYVYRESAKNLIVSADLFERLDKVERWRIRNEMSDDALTWNVFAAMSKLGGLPSVLEYLQPGIGPETSLRDLELYLWGNRISTSGSQFWSKIHSIRRDLVEAGIPTEPDIIVRAPGRAIVLVEAKVCAPKSTLPDKNERVGDVEQFLDRYQQRAQQPDPLIRGWIVCQQPGRVLEQLCRNVILAQRLAEDGEQPFVVNLTRESAELDVEERLAPHLNPQRPVGFRRATWEGIYRLPIMRSADALPLKTYLASKTSNLRQAFAV